MGGSNSASLKEAEAVLPQVSFFANQLRTHVPHDGDFLQSYAAAFLKSAAIEDETEETPDALLEIALHLREVAQQRSSKQPNVVVRPFIDASTGQNMTSVAIINDDMPFLVDSLVRALTEKSLVPDRLFHPVLAVPRDASGNLANNANTQRESWIYVDVAQPLSSQQCTDLQNELLHLYNSVQCVVADKDAMFALAHQSSTQLATAGLPEEAALIQQLTDGLFVLMAVNDAGKNLAQPQGLYRQSEFSAFKNDTNPNVALLTNDKPLIALKSEKTSVVHRRVPFDIIVVRRYDSNSTPIGERRFVGMLTSTAHATTIENLPLLRQKARNIVQRAGFALGGHDDKNLRHVLASFPRDELLQIDEDTLFAQAIGMARFETRPSVSVFSRIDPHTHTAAIMVMLPREALRADVRDKIAALLAQEYQTTSVKEVGSQLGETGALTVRYTLSLANQNVSIIDNESLEQKITRIAQPIDAQLREVFHNTPDISDHYNVYARAFTDDYLQRNADYLANDVRVAQTLSQSRHTALKVVRTGNKLLLRLYRFNTPMPLAECLPIFDNFGLRVLSEKPYVITTTQQTIYLQVLEATCDIGCHAQSAPLVEAAFEDMIAHRIENDALNALTTAAALPARMVTLLRAAVRYLRQANAMFDRAALETALKRNLNVATALSQFVEARFNPQTSNDQRAAQVNTANDALNTALSGVVSAEDDRVLRALKGFFKAVLRTNAYQRTAHGDKEYVSFKLASAQLSFLPQPVPYREIWVYSPRVEGIHIRFAPVSRGGLRWSDRREDFRTEVLGLVKAQRVKNSVIVPSGSKGGFYPKMLANLTADDRLQEAIACYKTFLRGLLDVTDNIANNTVVPPAHVVRYDNDDPYLVVAADKGTAAFSDIANGISAEYQFWLGDAFASGGSQGYDHKKMGITARGAWIAVQRHFREIGIDIQTTPFKVIGVGDMSGDVFGNGMLLSPCIQLVAAFDHRDIFIDPTPDCARSFAERQRMFALPRSSWQDYNKDLISAGGGVFSRQAKSIPLSPQMRDITGLSGDSTTPQELMKALLSAPTDLLWFGGIGTYIKAASESHADAGDKANDALRVDAEQVKAHVIGEGANLGLTQRGRIAFARKGGRINTDAVDNSAGVDCSDHEVNIKIALRYVQDQGRLNDTQRNQLLLDMTDNVSELVLRTNRDQTLALSVEEALAPRNLEKHRLFMRALEKDDLLNRVVETLPDERGLDVLKASNLGLSRPELAVLMAYAKLDATEHFLAAKATDDDYFLGLVTEYMPTALAQQFGDALPHHRLKSEIIATILANRLVNEVGITFLRHLLDDGIDAKQLLTTFAAVRGVLNSLMPDSVLYHHTHFKDAAAHTRFIARHRGIMRREILRAIHGYRSPAQMINEYTQIIHTVTKALPNTLQGAWLDEYTAIAQEATADCLQPNVAQALAAFSLPLSPFAVADVALKQGIDAAKAIEAISGFLHAVQLDKAFLRVVNIDTLVDPFERSAVRRASADIETTLEQVAIVLVQKSITAADIATQGHLSEVKHFAERLSAVPTLSSAHLQLLNHALQSMLSAIHNN